MLASLIVIFKLMSNGSSAGGNINADSWASAEKQWSRGQIRGLHGQRCEHGRMSEGRPSAESTLDQSLWGRRLPLRQVQRVPVCHHTNGQLWTTGSNPALFPFVFNWILNLKFKWLRCYSLKRKTTITVTLTKLGEFIHEMAIIFSINTVLYFAEHGIQVRFS